MNNRREIRIDNGTIVVERIGEHVILNVTIIDQPPLSIFLRKEQAQELGAALLDAMPIRSTRRELFAAAAMRSMADSAHQTMALERELGVPFDTPGRVAQDSVKLADALIAALDEKSNT